MSAKHAETLRERLSNSIGLPLSDILPEDMIQQTLEEENIKYRKRIFDPIVTLWIFIRQVLDPDKSCKNSVSFILSILCDSEEGLPSGNTGAYCKARKRLSLNFIMRLFHKTGKTIHQKASDGFLWCNRHVFLVDGSTFSMYDTPENQQEYPQAKNQHEYHGFPVARVLVIFCLATGAVIDAAISSLCMSEISLFRMLYSRLNPGDVALGDRLFGSYGDIALLSQRGIDSVFRMHHLRKTDFRKGKRLGSKGIYDHLVTWKKPRKGTLHLEPELYDRLPETMLVREIRYFIHIRGFRTEKVTLVTTLLDHHIYTYELLAELYGLRWQVEIDLRHLKTTMKMEHIHSKTPEMVRKEFYVHLLAYNLIRATLWEAGIKHSVHPLRLSYKGAIQHVLNSVPILAITKDRDTIYGVMLTIISRDKLLERPYRVEPRMVRSKKRQFPRLTRPRQEIRQKLIA